MAALSDVCAWIHWQAVRWLRGVMRQFGIRGIAIGIAVCTAAAALEVRHELQRQWVEINNAQKMLGETTYASSLPEPNAEAETLQALSTFEARLPDIIDVPQKIAELFEIASAQNLTLMRGDYKWQEDVHGAFRQYQISLPVRGEPVAVQNFIRLAMIELPTLSFEAVQFKRERIDLPTVDARIQWSLLVRMRDSEGGSVQKVPPARSRAGVSS